MSKTFSVLHRDFEFTRGQDQLLALAYQQVLPIIRSPTRPARPGAACRAGACVADDPSFQEEQDLETL